MRYIGGCTLPLLTNLLLTSWDIQTDPHQAAHFGTSNVNPSTQTTWCFHPISGIQLPSSVILNSQLQLQRFGSLATQFFQQKNNFSRRAPLASVRSCWNIAPKSAREFRVCGNCMGFWFGEGSRFPSSWSEVEFIRNTTA